MTNNYILRRLRYTFDFSDSQMIALFGLADFKVTREEISAWLKKDEDPAFVRLTDNQFALFLNGLIIEKRGKRDGPQPEAEHQLNNNIIFRKLKIAFNLIDEDILNMMKSANFLMGKPELTALFRKPGHRSYRECQDQILRNFLKGIQLKYHEGNDTKDKLESDQKSEKMKVTATPDKTQMALKRQAEVKEYQKEQKEQEQEKAPKKKSSFQWQPMKK